MIRFDIKDLTESVDINLHNSGQRSNIDVNAAPRGFAIDTELSPTSTNALQNKAIHAAISDAVASLELEMPKVRFNPTAVWNAEPSYVAEKDTIYVYTDYRQEDGRDIAGIKVGDGMTYLIDMPFLDTLYLEHTQNTDIHVTDEDRENWNNKVTAYYSLTDAETLVLSTD